MVRLTSALCGGGGPEPKKGRGNREISLRERIHGKFSGNLPEINGLLQEKLRNTMFAPTEMEVLFSLLLSFDPLHSVFGCFFGG